MSMPGTATPKIVGYMAVAVMFTVVSYEIDGTGKKFSPAKSILGGTLAAGMLSVLAETGQVGATLGVGLAATAMASAVLINGKPVWDWVSKQFGAQPATPAATTTTLATTTTTNPATTPAAAISGVHFQ